MDIPLYYCDKYLYTPYIYPTWWKEDEPVRQFISLYITILAGALLMYFGMAALDYYFIFDHRVKKHPQYLKDQARREIMETLKGMPTDGAMITACFFLEVRGYGKLYYNAESTHYDISGIVSSMLILLLFTDTLSYFIHRGLHTKLLYAPFHKLHHTWKIPTPFASHSFHPIDGFMQSVAQHMCALIFPIHKGVFLGFFLLLNIWTVSLHDADNRIPDSLQSILNGTAHHTDHHALYNYNYGQFFTFWDRVMGTYHHPSHLSGNAPRQQVMRQLKAEENGIVSEKPEMNGNGTAPHQNGIHVNGDTKKVA